MVEALLATTPPSLIPAQLIVNEPCAVLTNWPCSAKWYKGLHIGHFRAIIAPPRAVEQLEMQQSGLQRVSDWSRLFSAPALRTFGFQLGQPRGAQGAKGFVYARRGLVIRLGRLTGALRRDDSGQVNSTGNCGHR